MSQIQKILLGILSFWPIMSFIGLMIWQSFFFQTSTLSELVVIERLWTVTMIVQILLLIFYICDSLKNKKIPKTQKTFWVLLLIFLHPITMPIYFYTFILKRRG